MWRAAGLEEALNKSTNCIAASSASGDGAGCSGDVLNTPDEHTVDNTTAGGFFAWMGREPAQSGRGVHAGVNLGIRTIAGD